MKEDELLEELKDFYVLYLAILFDPRPEIQEFLIDDNQPEREECQEKLEKRKKQAYQEIMARIKKPRIDEGWLPTPENINALPEPVRKYIHDLETNTDPAHLVQENVLIKDTCKMLVLKLEEKPGLDIEKKGRELFAWSADPRTIKECEDFIRTIVTQFQGVVIGQ